MLGNYKMYTLLSRKGVAYIYIYIPARAHYVNGITLITTLKKCKYRNTTPRVLPVVPSTDITTHVMEITVFTYNVPFLMHYIYF